MEEELTPPVGLDERIAHRLKTLRGERGWSLDELAGMSGVSRATLSRLENAEVSPTATVLGKLCGVYGLTVSRLMLMVEDGFTPLIPHEAQTVWTDPETGFVRRSVSPPAQPLAGEVIECRLKPGTRIAYERSPRQGLEHHLLLVDGRLAIEVDRQTYDLAPGDCLRYRLSGPSTFTTPAAQGAHYLVFIL